MGSFEIGQTAPPTRRGRAGADMEEGRVSYLNQGRLHSLRPGGVHSGTDLDESRMSVSGASSAPPP